MFSITNKEQISSLLEASKSFAHPQFILSGTLRENFDSLVLSDLWPLEVPPSLIVNTPEQIRLRAASIVQSYNLHDFKDKKFLDFGCGTGECVIEATKLGVKAFGFDLEDYWQKGTAGIFTTDIEEVRANGPYDLITLYDVIDHTNEHEGSMEVLTNVAKVSNPNTMIRIRCHPYTSRHGGHLYETINRAFAHILLSEETLAKHLKGPMRKIKRPMAEYRTLFDEAGFRVVSFDKQSAPLEPLFKTPQMVEIFRMRLDGNRDWQESVLPITFIDFILRLK
jgi:SAM-dependent methyltransferase